MWEVSELVIAFVISCVTTLIITPFMMKLAIKLKAVDRPNNKRKMHQAPKPSMGGLAIFIGVAAGFIYLQPVHAQLNAVIIGACVMIITCILDGIIELRALYKLAGRFR